MTITRALTRVKTIKKQLVELENKQFIKAIQTVHLDDASTMKFKKESQSNYDQVVALIKEMHTIRNAINHSNNNTMVTVCDKTMSVAEALMFKEIVDFKENLNICMMDQYETALDIVETNKQRIEEKARKFAESTNSENQELALQLGLESAKRELEADVVAGFNINHIHTTHEFVQRFKENIDYALSESNATTCIDV